MRSPPKEQDMNYLTASSSRVARLCQRRYLIEYVLGYRRVRTDERLRFGTLIHSALEAWWRGDMNGMTDDEKLESSMEVLDVTPNVDPYELVRARVMTMGYHLAWCERAAGLEVLGVEERFTAPLEMGDKRHGRWNLAGRLDVRVQSKDGIQVIEHKTTTEDISPESTYWQRLKMDVQVSIYLKASGALGPPAESCIYDVLGKPRHEPSAIPVLDEHGNKVVLDQAGHRVKTQQGKWRQTADAVQGFVLQTRQETPPEFQSRLAIEVGQTPSRFFSSATVVRLEDETESAMRDLWHLASILDVNTQCNQWMKNPDACFLPGRTCPYISVCAGENTLYSDEFRRVPVHPELEET